MYQQHCWDLPLLKPRICLVKDEIDEKNDIEFINPPMLEIFIAKVFLCFIYPNICKPKYSFGAAISHSVQ